MLNYKKIMCAFEFDGNSTAALRLSGTLAKESNATLYILHIARVPTQDMDVPLPFDSHPRWEKEAGSRLEPIVRSTLMLRFNMSLRSDPVCLTLISCELHANSQ